MRARAVREGSCVSSNRTRVVAAPVAPADGFSTAIAASTRPARTSAAVAGAGGSESEKSGFPSRVRAARRARSFSAIGRGPEIATRAGTFSPRPMRAVSTCTVARDTSG